MLRSKALSREPEALRTLRGSWNEVVGDDRSAQMTPLRIQGDVLWVRVHSPALYFEMTQFGSAEFLTRVNETVPGRFLRIRFCQ